MCTISPPIHVYVSVCYQSIFRLSVCTVSCQSVTLTSHTTCLSFVNVYVDTCPPICHIHARYFPSLRIRPSVCDTPSCIHVFLFFCICLPVLLPIRHIHMHNVLHICLCVCVFALYVRISCSQLCVRASV